MGLLAAVVANDLVNLYDDVLGDLGLYRIAIDHLDESDALFVILYRGYFEEYFEFFGYNYTDEVTGNICFPCAEFFQGNEITRHDDRRKQLIRDYMLKKHFVFTEYRFIFVYLTHKMKIFY